MSGQPCVFPRAATALPVPTARGLTPTVGFSVNAQINPRGRPATWHVEYGATTAYGTSTTPRALPGKLTAHFEEDWTDGLNGWDAGLGGAVLVHHASGGYDGGGYVSHIEENQGAGGDDDNNHLDGIGTVHLGLFGYTGELDPGDTPQLFLGGGATDFRGAKIGLYIKSADWNARGSKLGTWLQGNLEANIYNPGQAANAARCPNWAYTGEYRAPTSSWVYQEITLRNRTQDWTLGGADSKQGRPLYCYGELDSVISRLSLDLFPIQLLDICTGTAVLSRDPRVAARGVRLPPLGTLDYDKLSITFRQHSVCVADNGGSLESAPAGGTGTGFLVDGWRNGTGREWVSQDTPTNPQDFIYAFANPIVLWSASVFNSVNKPAKDIEIAVSENGGGSWTTISSGTLPDTSVYGSNALYHHVNAHFDDSYIPVYANPINRMRVRILNGYQSDRWALGEIEAFGTGAVELTEDECYDCNQDIVVAPGTYHYRVAATTDRGTRYGADQTVVVAGVPATQTPIAVVPNDGPAAGGTTVVVQFADALTVMNIMVDAALPKPMFIINPKIIDATHVRGTTVAHAAGAVAITSINVSGESAPLAAAFTFT